MRVLLTAFIFTLSHWALAEDSAGLIQDYDQTSWQESDTGAQIAAFEDQLAAWQQLDDTSEVLMWRGAVAASIARAKGGVGALGLLKQAKKDLDAAIQADPDNSMAVAIQANLFAKAPGWPLSVGNSKKAAAGFTKALAADPSNILALQGYGEFLAEKGDIPGAKIQYRKALTLAPRVGREMADQARQQTIQGLLDAL